MSHLGLSQQEENANTQSYIQLGALSCAPTTGMTKTLTATPAVRLASQDGETLFVRQLRGVKVLTDACNEQQVVIVPHGRLAKLICFAFCGLPGAYARDAHVAVNDHQGGIAFASVRYPGVRVFLHELLEGQRVDILPAVDAAAAYAVVIPPLPVLYGAAIPQLTYAATAA